MGSGTTLSNFTGSSYQLGKFYKHTLPVTHSGLNSLFDDPNYSAYSNYIVSTLYSGSTEFDNLGRKNIIWYAGKDIGISYLNGIPIGPTDVVKVVLPHDGTKIHAFPVKLESIVSGSCQSCGTHVLTGSTQF